MSIGFNRLKAENAQLRTEIFRLKHSLRGYSGDTSNKLSSTILKVSNRSTSYKQTKKPQILDFKYQSRKKETSPLVNIESKSRKYLIQTPIKSNYDTYSSIFTTQSSKRNISSRPKLNSVSKDILPLQERHSPFRTLKDSFDSYYDSEEENLDQTGKCELSFIEYQYTTNGQRRKEKNLSQQVQELKKQNQDLKQKLNSSKVPKLKLTDRKKSSRRTTIRSSLPVTPNSRSTRKSSRSAHLLTSKCSIPCQDCIHLLSKGYSTFFCSKHGKK